MEARESRRSGQQHAQAAFVEEGQGAAIEEDVPVEVLKEAVEFEGGGAVQVTGDSHDVSMS